MTSKTPSPRSNPSSAAGIRASGVSTMRPSTLANSGALMPERGYRRLQPVGPPAEPARARLESLDHGRDSLPDADAESRDPVAVTAPPQLPNQGGHQPGAGAAERMTEGDRAAVHVEALLVDAEPLGAGQDLGGERLIQLDQVDLSQLESGLVESLGDRNHWPDPHVGGVDAGDADRDDAGERLLAQLAGGLLRTEHEAGRSVIER